MPHTWPIVSFQLQKEGHFLFALLFKGRLSDGVNYLDMLHNNYFIHTYESRSQNLHHTYLLRASRLNLIVIFKKIKYMHRQSIFNNKMNLLLFATIASHQGQLLNALYQLQLGIFSLPQ